LTPRRAKIRHKAVTNRLLPAEELLPWIINALAVIYIPGGCLFIAEIALSKNVFSSNVRVAMRT
jgi:hypothetical protein